MINFRKFWRWFLIALGIVAVRSTTCTNLEEPEYFYEYSYIENELSEAINKYRTDQGINVLAINDNISKLCAEHSQFMANNLNVCHDGFAKRANELITKISAKSVGEVVAFGYGTAFGVLYGWAKSDTHRKILERNSFTDFGVSARKNKEGRYYFTVIFTRQ